MKTTQRVLAILALVILSTQLVRHAYVRWFAPRTSVLDRFERPLGERIAAARSLDEIMRLYEPVRAEADRLRKAAAAKSPAETVNEYADTEPFQSERQLREAIAAWEGKAKEVHSLWFYWSVGLLLLLAGLWLYRSTSRWYGLAAEITAFAEFVYWTSPSFMNGNVREFDRLLSHKLFLTALSLVLLVLVIQLQRPFSEEPPAATVAT